MKERIKELAEQADDYANWSLDTDPRVNWYEVRDTHFFELVRKDERELCAKVCDDYAEDKWNLYKGRSPYTGKEEGRADPHVQGESCGAMDCAEAIRGRTE